MEYLENRELSWLKFNKRVLEEATDPDTPLLERLSFSAIYQSNLDEFFMVRVGSVTDKAKSEGKKKDKFSGMNAAQQLDAIFTAVRRLQPSVEEALRSTMKELAPYGFEHVTFDKATKEELMLLPDVNEKTAEAILSLREGIHGFSNVYELLYVDELTQKQVAELIEFVTVGE